MGTRTGTSKTGLTERRPQPRRQMAAAELHVAEGEEGVAEGAAGQAGHPRQKQASSVATGLSRSMLSLLDRRNVPRTGKLSKT